MKKRIFSIFCVLGVLSFLACGSDEFASARTGAQKELSELKAKMAATQEQTETMEKQIRSARSLPSELAKVKKQRKGYQRVVEEENKALETAGKEISQLKTELAEVEKKSSELGWKLVGIKQIEAGLEKEKNLSAEAEAKAEEARALCSSAEKNVSVLRKKLASAERQKTRLQADLEKALKMQKQLEYELRKTKSTRAESDLLVNKFASARTGAQKELLELKAKMAATWKQTETMEKQIRSARSLPSELAKVKKQRKGYQRVVEEENKALETAGREISQLKTELAEVEKKSSELGWNLAGIKQIEAGLEKEKNLSTEAEAKAEKTQESRKAAEKNLSVLKDKVACAKKHMKKAEKESAKVEKTKAALRADLEKERAIIAKTLVRVADQEKAVKALNAEMSVLEGKLADAEKVYVKKKKHVSAVSQLRYDLKKEQSLSQAAKKKLEKVDSIWNDYEEKVACLTASLARIDKKLTELDGKSALSEKLSADLKKLKKQNEDAIVKAKAEEDAHVQLPMEIKAIGEKIDGLEVLIAKAQKQFENGTEQYRRSVSSESANKETKFKERIQILEKKLSVTEKLNVDLSKLLAKQLQQLTQRETSESTGAKDSLLDIKKRVVNVIRAEKEEAESVESEKPSPQEKVQRSVSKAKAHYQQGVERWDKGDIDGAIDEFKQAVRFDPDSAGALYNLGLAYLHKDDKTKACDYAYRAGKCYMEHGNTNQALRMVIFLKAIDPNSSLIKKIQKTISEQTPR